MHRTPSAASDARFLGIDLGAETIKIVELRRRDGTLVVHDTVHVEHHKDPAATLARLLSAMDWPSVNSAAATGRMSRMLALERVPTNAALSRGAIHHDSAKRTAGVRSMGVACSIWGREATGSAPRPEWPSLRWPRNAVKAWRALRSCFLST